MNRFTAILCLTAAISACTPSSFTDSPDYPDIFPDYVGVTIPEGMPDPVFRMSDGRRFKVTRTRGEGVVNVEVKAWEKGSRKGIRYAAFPIYLSKDPVEPYIAYRLIEPGYEGWRGMGIYQRDLFSYKETAIVTNKVNNMGCVNCHTFPGGNPDRMLFHARGEGGGTVFIDGGKVSLVNLASTGLNKQGTYPAWHPGGRYVAFSSNSTSQSFSLAGSQPIEVYDTASDIILMDLETGGISSCDTLLTEDVLETFPAWSPDGNTLYYCAANDVDNINTNRRFVHYRIMSIGFSDGKFTGDPQVVWESEDESASFPRVSGKWLMFTVSGYGTFPIWHKEADLRLLNLETGETLTPEILNSDDTESYHSWSGNGHWLIFSSRRLDGRYTRLYIAHHDGNGNFGKPFLLPQKNPDLNQFRLKSYNIPEFINGEVCDRQKEISGLF